MVAGGAGAGAVRELRQVLLCQGSFPWQGMEPSVLTERVLKPTGKGKQRRVITMRFLLVDK